MQQPDRLLGLNVVAKRLDVSRFLLRRLIKEGELEAYRIGQRWKVSERQYAKFMYRALNHHEK